MITKPEKECKKGSEANYLAYSKSMNECDKYDFSLFEPKQSKSEVKSLQSHKAKKIKPPKQKDSKKIITVISLLAVCFVIILNIFVRAEVTSLSFKQNKIKKEIKSLKSIQTSLDVEYESIISYDVLEREALKLGMSKLERKQVIYVDIDEQ